MKKIVKGFKKILKFFKSKSLWKIEFSHFTNIFWSSPSSSKYIPLKDNPQFPTTIFLIRWWGKFPRPPSRRFSTIFVNILKMFNSEKGFSHWSMSTIHFPLFSYNLSRFQRNVHHSLDTQMILSLSNMNLKLKLQSAEDWRSQKLDGKWEIYI